ncbi:MULTISPECIES: M14 family metallopeptidase [unclassified Variovorax]|uniref:M14 family metallopeptidase n=1 Tax=unclassified Variovorax TaxID=663243 RepID=UPI00076CC13F|nr:MULTISPECIES: M14 family metallopeptidase [unclassified Variovorax]KWT97279.1 hypothetical protein APY03_1654 [Variovorax sp. WDL1]PNG56236.1 hypothetical protein CHC07_02651 [Variovorax sp. B4]PNG57660.1 hypothetical protein CHC06_02654 [Variovorax sp. B2]VTV09921.1 hypothetical protein WDL1CHR_00976 [Variovorax sp. WDL1]
MLQQLDHLPPGFMTAAARELHRVLPGPTLIHLPGDAPERLFVSILLHGNEDVGLLALQSVLASYGARRLPRGLSVFVGNVDAAGAGVRRLDDQPDFNRIWSTAPPRTPYEHMAAAVVEVMRQRAVFATLDLHNNSGRNPLYSCLSGTQRQHLVLARLFSPLAVLIESQPSLGAAFAAFSPSISCECGEIGSAQGVFRAAALIDRCLRAGPALFESGDASGEGESLDIFEAFAVLKVAESLSLACDDHGDNEADIRLLPEIESLNFRALEAGHVIATTAPQLAVEPLRAFGLDGRPIAGLFRHSERRVRLAQPAIAAMLTRDLRAIRQDCLGYLMRRVRLAAS